MREFHGAFVKQSGIPIKMSRRSMLPKGSNGVL